MIIYPSVKRNTHAPVAQLDRVTDYESVGQGFESLPAYQKAVIPFGMAAFLFMLQGDSNNQMQQGVFCKGCCSIKSDIRIFL